MAAKTTHAMTNSLTFISWSSMKSRCLNPKATSWSNYGGRGIKVCDRWLNSFENFYADMGPRPSLEYSIDRKDNDGNYEPNNCQWATDLEQVNNRRDTQKYKDPVTNELLTMRDLYEKYASNRTPILPIGIFSMRFKKGWSLKDILDTPIDTPDTYLYQGIQRSLTEIAKMNDVEDYNLRHHIRRGMSVEDALEYLLHGAVSDKSFAHSKHNLYTYQGKQYTLKGLAQLSNIPRNMLADRLHSGMSVEKALTATKYEAPKYIYQGEEYGLMSLLALTGIPRNTFMRYLSKHGSADEAIKIYKERVSGTS